MDNLHSNWAYIVMASIGLTLKAWFALLMSVPSDRWTQRYQAQKEEVLKMEFKRFANSLIQVPCRNIKAGRRIVYRLLPWRSVDGSIAANVRVGAPADAG